MSRVTDFVSYVRLWVADPVGEALLAVLLGLLLLAGTIPIYLVMKALSCAKSTAGSRTMRS